MTRLLLFSLGFALHAHAAPSPPLAALQIEIWPEYDRPRALVILKGELGKDAPSVALRIPASAGGPSALAYADESGKLLNLPYEQQADGSFIRLQFRPTQRNFHLEFYDALGLDSAQREYRYTWPADLAVGRLSVLVKEPAAASNLTVSPPLATAGLGPDGLALRAAELGARPAGQPLPIELRYTKSDPRPSTEIAAARAAPAAAQPWWRLPAMIAAGAALLGGIGLLVWRPRRVPASGAFCAKCGRAAREGDRFCASCGAALM